MGFFIDSQGNYYEGDRASLADVSVPPRPSYRHKFTDGEWILDEMLVDEETKAEALKKLKEIDLKSIRSIREWIATQPTASKYIADYETEAQVERAKVNAICAKNDAQVDGEVLPNS